MASDDGADSRSGGDVGSDGGDRGPGFGYEFVENVDPTSDGNHGLAAVRQGPYDSAPDSRAGSSDNVHDRTLPAARLCQ